jgi:hypothetical protein
MYQRLAAETSLASQEPGNKEARADPISLEAGPYLFYVEMVVRELGLGLGLGGLQSPGLLCVCPRASSRSLGGCSAVRELIAAR